MGIKGRRKKLREREAKARANLEEERQQSGGGSDSDGDGDGGVNNSGIVVMGGGPFRPPVDALGRLKIKKSELYKMQDQDYLDRIQEEHSTRRQSHLRQGGGGASASASAGDGAGGGGGGRQGYDPDAAADEAMAAAELVAREYLIHREPSPDKDEAQEEEEEVVVAESGRKRKELIRSARRGNAKRGRVESTSAAAAPSKGTTAGGGNWSSALGASSSSPHLLKGADLVDEQTRMLAHRRKAGRGARFSHPLIGLDPVVVSALDTEGFLRMTLIQERTIPYAIEGYDLLGQARTGSGKTLAFCVPVLHVCLGSVKKFPHATAALMLAPTKELCVQTHDVLTSVCQHIPASEAHFTVQLITGGTKVTEERKRLTAGSSIVVGTPGRIHDHVRHCKCWNLERLRFLVLDEADRMLADGFQRDLDAILAKVPRARQTLLFSATNSKSVHELARLSLAHTPLFVDTVSSDPHPIDLTTDVEGDRGGKSAARRSRQQHAGDSIGLVPMAAPMPYRNYDDVDSDGSEEDGHDDEEEEEHEEEESNDSNDSVSSSESDDGDASHEEAQEKEDGGSDGDGDDDQEEAIPSTLRQFCHVVALEDRLRSLYAFVKQVARTSKAMVFCSTVASTIFHFQMMGSVGFHDDVMMLHGHMKHRQRVQTFQLFRQWQTGVLFCTDVAARGLDIPNVEWILQFDPPLDPTEYIHRIGRTARAGNVGSALLFLAPEEANFIKYLSKFGITLERYTGMSDRLPRIQEQLEHVLQLDDVVAKSAVTAFRAHVGAYQSHILKETFSVHKLDLDRLAVSFALTATPHVTLPKNAVEERKREYVKGKLKSLNRRKMEALRHYEQCKVKAQWDNGRFVGVSRPAL